MLFNSFCFLSFIMVFVVGAYFVLIDLFSYPVQEWITIVSKAMMDDPKDSGTQSLIQLIPFLPCSWICIYHEYRYIEYSKRAPSGVWYGICGLLLLFSLLILLSGFFLLDRQGYGSWGEDCPGDRDRITADQ
ncbi:hypothetical protein [Herpetosiphon giganteus]|uniref:hypothetical protein n=1 Tax=Herpetosiphon giganteus TaxID=2029754 RepID=UPI001957499F|nr:hypothetical protein [Herpetosiphon giganteus]MBM7845719.1 hypothetical protein [Herpetosiphon giganteus]